MPRYLNYSLFLLLSLSLQLGCENPPDLGKAIRAATVRADTPQSAEAGQAPKSSATTSGKQLIPRADQRRKNTIGKIFAKPNEQGPEEQGLEKENSAEETAPALAVPITAKQESTANPTNIRCPQGAKLLGSAPPKGSAQWCAMRGSDGTSIKHGDYRRWHRNGTIQTEATYINGKPEGKVVKHYSDGSVQEEKSYVDGNLDGEFTKYNKDGTKRFLTTYQLGLKHGRYAKWSNKGFPQEEGLYEEDLKIGTWKTFHFNGQPRSITNYKDGLKHGNSEDYSREGVLLSRGSYEDNLQTGIWSKYNSKGKIKSEGAYLDGRRHGRWIYYDRLGSISKITWFDNGILLRQERRKRGRSNSQSKPFGARDQLGAPPPEPKLTIPDEASPESGKSKDPNWEPL